MKRLLLSMLCLAATFLPTVIENASAQAAPTPDAPQTGVVLTKLSTPVYPPLARLAAVVGEVRIQLGIRQDGNVASAEVVSGHPMLKQAALDSAQQSQFACHGCSTAITTYELVYSFALPEKECWGPSRTKVTQLQNRVTIDDVGPILCDPGVDVVKKRSAKCLYLWKCGTRS